MSAISKIPRFWAHHPENPQTPQKKSGTNINPTQILNQGSQSQLHPSKREFQRGNPSKVSKLLSFMQRSVSKSVESSPLTHAREPDTPIPNTSVSEPPSANSGAADFSFQAPSSLHVSDENRDPNAKQDPLSNDSPQDPENFFTRPAPSNPIQSPKTKPPITSSKISQKNRKPLSVKTGRDGKAALFPRSIQQLREFYSLVQCNNYSALLENLKNKLNTNDEIESAFYLAVEGDCNGSYMEAVKAILHAASNNISSAAWCQAASALLRKLSQKKELIILTDERNLFILALQKLKTREICLILPQLVDLKKSVTVAKCLSNIKDDNNFPHQRFVRTAFERALLNKDQEMVRVFLKPDNYEFDRETLDSIYTQNQDPEMDPLLAPKASEVLTKTKKLPPKRDITRGTMSLHSARRGAPEAGNPLEFFSPNSSARFETDTKED